jgi:hypothetical protein
MAKVLSHLAGRRQARTLPGPRHPPVNFISLGLVQDCYLDTSRAALLAPIDVRAEPGGPCIVSRIATRYSDRYPEFATTVMMASGQDGPQPEEPT